MLGEVSGYKDEQLVKSIEIGDLSMGANDITVYDHYQIGLTKGFDGSPEGSLTATGHFSDGSFFRVDLTIIGPKPKKSKYYLPLTSSETKNLLEAISNIIITLEEKTR